MLEENELSEKEKLIFQDLENTVCKLITMAVSKGDTYIMTNSNQSWIYYSAKKYYTDKAEKIVEKVNLVSCRHEYEKSFPGDTNKWKLNSFLDTAKNLNHKLLTNIICVGDSLIDISSANKLGEKFNNCYVKTIKMKNNPKIEEIDLQLNVISKQFESIYSSIKNLNIKLGKKESPTNN